MQTSYATTSAIARAGMLGGDSRAANIISRLAATVVVAGRGVFRFLGYGIPVSQNGDPGSCYQQASPSAAALTTAIIASGGASTTGIQTLTSFNGTYGGSATEKMTPARLVTLILNSHADWDATNAVLTGVDYRGITVSETLAIPNGGNATVTSTTYFQYVTSLVIPAQTGTNGTFTLGVAALDASVTLADFEGVAIFDASISPDTTPSQDQTSEYHLNDTVAVLRGRGSIWVYTEDACTYGEPVYVRIGAGAGGTEIGAFRSDADTATAVVVTGARWGKTSAAAGLNLLELA